MAVNNRLVTEFIDRVTPYIKKGVKKLETFSEKHLKPSENSEELLQRVEAKGAEYDEVAPFAQRLIQPEMFGMNPAINRIRTVVRNTRKVISQTKDDRAFETFNNLYNKILDETSNIEGLSGDVVNLFQKTELVDNPNIKGSILSYLDSMVKKPKEKFRKSFKYGMTMMEDFADTANILNGKYLRTDEKTVGFYRWMKERDIWLLDVIEGTKKGEADYRRNLITKSKQTKKYADYLKGFDKFSSKKISQTFENDLKAESLRDFIYYYGDRHEKAADYLYRAEYLKTLPADIAKECEEIRKVYKTYVIPTNGDISPEDMKYLKEELRLWKEAGKGEEILPKVINVDILDEYLIRRKCSGCADVYDNTLKVLDLLAEDGAHNSVGSTLRHEIQHLQDDSLRTPKNDLEIMRDKLKWFYHKLLHRSAYKKELVTKGGLDEELFEYALTKPCELLSVTSEAQMKNLSKGYKNYLHKYFHMKKWIFDIGDNEVSANSRRRDLAKHLTEEAMKKVDKA